MTAQFARAPVSGRLSSPSQSNPQAALLIDFDNVTMGIRSDLTKELKNLLNSDVIKGKVAVQRAYADWRRYPQYIVPLSEASVDLIFAPAYGSVKKNATDIRLAIDALELVFTRPEIGTFILLSGDSDFSSLVLKLKEYGKYVVGVGIRESASDLLVQNCDEYYSYSALTGLTRTSEEAGALIQDPWELVEMAVRQMEDAGDVMRSDRLKQVMLDLDPNFDEKTLGFSKFNRFLVEASNRGLLRLNKQENGQFDVALAEPEDAESAAAREENQRADGRRGRSRRARARRDEERREDPRPVPSAGTPPATAPSQRGRRDLAEAFAILQRAVGELVKGDGAARDSDVKRRILEFAPDWDEANYGFSKFSRFLRQAHDAEVVNLSMLENGSYEITLPETAAPAPAPAARKEPETERAAQPPSPASGAAPYPGSLGLRRGTRGRAGSSAPPPLLEGQAVVTRGEPAKATPATAQPDPVTIGYPTSAVEVISYLATQFNGVGQKMAETLVDAFGAPQVFRVLKDAPERVTQLLGEKRGAKLLAAWQEDYRARLSGATDEDDSEEGADTPPRTRRRGRRGGRRRRTSRPG